MKSTLYMHLYAGFLLVCGFVAWAMAGFESRAKTALFVSLACAFLMVICAQMARMIERRRTLGMVGIHAGVILPLLFAVVFGLRAYKTFDTGGDDKRYLAIILSVMTVGSLAAFAAILSTRPSKMQRANQPGG